MTQTTLKYDSINKICEEHSVMVIKGGFDRIPFFRDFACLIFDAPADDPEARKVLEFHDMSDDIPGPVGLFHLSKCIELEPEIDERLNEILFDDEDEYFFVKEVLAKLIYFWSDITGPIYRTKAERDRFLEIARDARSLADKIKKYEGFAEFEEWPNRTERLERSECYSRIKLKEIEEHYITLASHINPSGKRPIKNLRERFIARALCDGISEGYLSLSMATNNDSDLAGLFRLCCRAVGLPDHKNANHYLKDYSE